MVASGGAETILVVSCGGSGSVPLASIPAADRVEGYYWVRRGDVPEVAFWSVRGSWQFVWSDRDWQAEGIEVLSDRLPPPGGLPPPL